MYSFEKSKPIFSENLKYLLQVNNITREQLAERTGISLNTINNYCKPKDKGVPNIENVCRIAEALDVDVQELVDFREAGDITSNFYPSADDITLQGIFSAVNYLIVAFGEDIFMPVESHIEYFAGIEDDTVSSFNIARNKPEFVLLSLLQETENGRYRSNAVGKYIKSIYENRNIKNQLLDIGQRDIYEQLLKKWASIDDYYYDSKMQMVVPFARIGDENLPV